MKLIKTKKITFVNRTYEEVQISRRRRGAGVSHSPVPIMYSLEIEYLAVSSNRKLFFPLDLEEDLDDPICQFTQPQLGVIIYPHSVISLYVNDARCTKELCEKTVTKMNGMRVIKYHFPKH